MREALELNELGFKEMNMTCEIELGGPGGSMGEIQTWLLMEVDL